MTAWWPPIEKTEFPHKPPRPNIRFEPKEPLIVIEDYKLSSRHAQDTRINYLALTIDEAETLWAHLDRALTEARRAT